MIFSTEQMFSNAQAITATAASENVIDLGATGTVLNAPAALSRDIGPGRPIPIVIQVTQSFTLLTSLTFALELDSTDTFTPDKSIDLGTYLLASLVAGFRVPYTYIPDGVDLRYMRLKYTVAGTNPDAGKITAGIVLAAQKAP